MQQFDDLANSDSPFHAGERQLQSRANRRERIEAMGRRVIRNYLTEQHREFFRELAYVLVGSLDAEGRPWASLLSGDPGFIESPTAQSLVVAAQPLAGDPLTGNLAAGAPLALLGIDLYARRRNRLSATVMGSEPDGEHGDLHLQVLQSFGNCPQYIQSRRLLGRPTHKPGRAQPLSELTGEHRALIAASDTFFVASASGAAPNGAVHASQGVDISHRGGRPGFVHVADDGLLTIPDFPGNNYFNTLGNILQYPRVGLLFVDFDGGDLLSLTGEAKIEWDPLQARHYQGAQRYWTVRPQRGVLLRRALPWLHGAPTPSPQTQRTGSWEQAPLRTGAARG